jgi:hypothetical protein
MFVKRLDEERKEEMSREAEYIGISANGKAEISFLRAEERCGVRRVHENGSY